MIRLYLAIGSIAALGALAWAIDDFGYDRAHEKWEKKWNDRELEITSSNLEHEKKIRDLQTELQSTADRVNKDAKVQIDKLEGDLLAASASAGSLRDKVAKYAASAKKCAGNPGAANASETADAPAVVLGRLFSWTDQSAGELAEFADRSRIAGLACEQFYDNLRLRLILEAK